MPGSPPQVRGKHYTNGVDIALAGITPAGAGKTIQSLSENVTPWDHPRRCGENRCQRQPIIEYIGSPPQVRGKQLTPPHSSRQTRITPAGAGKTTQFEAVRLKI